MGLSYNPNARAEWPINVLQKRMAIKLEKRKALIDQQGATGKKERQKQGIACQKTAALM